MERNIPLMRPPWIELLKKNLSEGRDVEFLKKLRNKRHTFLYNLQKGRGIETTGEERANGCQQILQKR